MALVSPRLARRAWHKACSRAPRLEDAIHEVLSAWPSTSRRERLVRPDWPRLERVQRVWQAWRMGSDETLAELARADGLQEAFKLFPDRGADVVYPEWREVLRWEKLGRPPPDEAWKAEKRRGAVAAALRNCALQLRDEVCALKGGFPEAYWV